MIAIAPTDEQLQAWTAAADGAPLDVWLTELANAAALTERPWPRVVKLKHPVDFNNDRIATITLRRGKLGDVKGLKVDRPLPVDTVMLIASRLSGQPVAMLEMLDLDDAGPVMEAAWDFLERCLSSGAMQ